MTDDSAFAQRYLACVGDPSRFRILVALTRGEECVTELARQVGLSQSCTTRHLQALRSAGVVGSDRRGKQVYFRLESESGALHPVLNWALGTAGDVNGARLEAGADGRGWRTENRGSGSLPSDDGRPARRRRSETRPRRSGTTSDGMSSGPPRSLSADHGAEHEHGWSSDAGPTGPGRRDSSRAESDPDRQELHTTVGTTQELDDFLL
jgi:DNA-binding transcriptional ArsR family regulator